MKFTLIVFFLIFFSLGVLGYSVHGGVLGAVIPADRGTLHRPTCVWFKGKFYILGGYFDKQVPSGYVLWTPPFSSQSTGVQYETKMVLNKTIYEITDPDEAFILEIQIKNKRFCSFAVNHRTWKDVGSVQQVEAIRDRGYYLEFQGKIYVIGGAGHKVGKETSVGETYDEWINAEYSDVWVSEDLRTWKRVSEKVPWSAKAKCRGNHTAWACDGKMFVTGDNGGSLTGDNTTEICFEGTWQSVNGADWTRVKAGTACQDNSNILKIDNRRYLVEGRESDVYSHNGKSWQYFLNSKYLLDIYGSSIAMFVPKDEDDIKAGLYSTTDGVHWRHRLSGAELSLDPYEKDRRQPKWIDNDSYKCHCNFNVVHFNGSVWLISDYLNYIYKSEDGINWKKVPISNKESVPMRRSATVGAYGGYLWIMGGYMRSEFAEIRLNDVWRSKDGTNWELVLRHAPWGYTDYGYLQEHKGQLYLFSGIVSRFGVWRTTDGKKWEDVSDKVVIDSRDSRGEAEYVLETPEGLRFYDEGAYVMRIRDKKVKDFSKVRDLSFRKIVKNIVKTNVKGKNFFLGHSNWDFFASRNLFNWEELDIKLNPDCRHDMKCKLFSLENKLFIVEVDQYECSEKGNVHSYSIKPVLPDQVMDSKENEPPAPKDTLRIKITEHLSWDNYDEKAGKFRLGDKNNKPIAGKKVRIRLSDGSIVEKITDANGVIELPGQDPNGRYELIPDVKNGEIFFSNGVTPSGVRRK